MKQENERLSAQISDLLEQVEEINAKKNSFENEIETLTEQLEQANTDNAKFQEQIGEYKDNIKEKTKQLDKMETELAASKENLDNLNHTLTKQEKTAKEREEQLMVQLESMAEQISKLRGVIRKRDGELVSLQKDILTKEEQAEGAQEEVDKLRTVGIVQREAVQDTTVLRRRVNDLEVELEQLRRALEKDPKYRIYLLVRETGQRTLEELSKVLGVGVFEARRRVQELVRAGLLDLQNDKVKVSRRR
jgi:chromosome segregation ATPase